MTVSIDDIEQRDLIFVDYPFEDDPTHSKKRPALVIYKENGATEVLAMKVTSQDPKDSYDYSIIEWMKANLKKPSVARTSKIVKIQEKDIIFKIGTLEEKDFLAVIELLKTYTKDQK